jgi:phospholipase C
MMKLRRLVTVAAALAVAASAALAAGWAGHQAVPAAASTRAAQGIRKIKHVIVILQENRSFDSYFGTTRTMPTPREPDKSLITPIW